MSNFFAKHTKAFFTSLTLIAEVDDEDIPKPGVAVLEYPICCEEWDPIPVVAFENRSYFDQFNREVKKTNLILQTFFTLRA